MLLLALLLPRANRTKQIWLVWLPVVALKCLIMFSLVAIPFGGRGSEPFAALFDALLLGLAMMWTMVPVVAQSRRLVTFLSSVGVLTGTNVAVCVLRLGLSGTAVQMLATVVLVCTVIVLSLLVAGLGCRKRVGILRFLGRLALWDAILTFGILFGILLLTQDLDDILIFPYVGTIYAMVIFLVMLPFAVLAYCVLPFRRRSVCMGLFPESFLVGSVPVDAPLD